MNIWFILGICLLIWTLWDLYTGKSWFITKMYIRKIQPVMYWVSWSVWFIVALFVLAGAL